MSGGVALVLGAIIVVIVGISESDPKFIALGVVAFPLAVYFGSKIDEWERKRR